MNFRVLSPLVLAMVVLGVVACSVDTMGAWKSPANQEQLTKLESRTLEPGISPLLRARLFFLWGQELAGQSRQASAPGAAVQDGGQAGTSAAPDDPGELRKRAIAAFAKVIDLQAGLEDEGRFNLEILLREQAQQDQQDQEKPDEKSDQQDKKSGDQDQKSDQQEQKPDDQDEKSGKQDQKSGKQEQKPGDQGKETRDLSSLVKDKAGDANLEQALKQENLRKAQEQTAQLGTIVPVDKDW